MSAALSMTTVGHDDEAFGGEARLLARLRAGDERAYEELVRANGGRMLATARRFLRSEEDAREVVQEALLQAFRALPRFAGNARLSTWLHRIVINAALMRLRSQRRRPEQSIEELLPHFEADGARIPDAADEPMADAAIDGAERRALVRRAIARLPDGYRTVLLLRDVEELDTEETARRLGTTPGAVKTRLHRARQALRVRIAEEHAAATGSFAIRVEEALGA